MKISLLSEFNLETLALYLRKSLGDQAEVVVAPFGQFTPSFLDPEAALWQPSPDVCLIWTRPEAVLPSVKASLQGAPVGPDNLGQEVEVFAELVRLAATRARFVFLASWTLPVQHAGGSLTDLSSLVGPARMVMMANLRLLEAVSSMPNVWMLDSAPWMQRGGAAAFSPRHWYGAKVPFANDVFKAATADLISAVRGVTGKARKLIVLDLDDTLWGGVVGDVGVDGIVLGGHDPVGEALVDFQQELKTLTRRGIALGIVSKNTEAVALEAIANHPEMVLRADDFAGWRINWTDKAQNLADLTRDLNLTLASVVFIDDNPAERARVREAFPEVLVPEWPSDPRLYPQALLSLDCFNQPSLTDEDQRRAEMYVGERKRSEQRQSAATMDDWIASLRMEVTVCPLDRGNLTRIAQLVNKTNQMNLRTRRLTETELWDWTTEEKETRGCWGFRLRDCFGDSGLTGVLSMEPDGGHARIVDFILSCRVMGRRVERILLQVAVEWAREAGLTMVEAVYEPTGRNQPCLEFFRGSGWNAESNGSFTWNTDTPYGGSPLITIVRTEPSEPDDSLKTFAETHE